MVFDVFRLRTSTDLVRYFLVDNGGEVNTFIAHLVYWGAHVAGAVLATIAWSAHTKTGMYAVDAKKMQ